MLWITKLGLNKIPFKSLLYDFSLTVAIYLLPDVHYLLFTISNGEFNLAELMCLYFKEICSHQQAETKRNAK